ncbi:MAG: hypothetical protein KKB90_01090 [Actinobacteria bacterium]|nr:hypothetical protein [Actinomycetota bacterium]MCG2817955.1 hypothetical protein [Actinomycetes bacterium]MBU4180026.1 hypothetical protein [Actinomycetota bacterium]MBU4217543.1 hypothetical protein [Actinomycetota bacterium]MBU4360112.1 hypothetical protein [Actinomycetota bacterium]
MPRKKKEKELKWRFYWKNIDGLGRFNRLVGGLQRKIGARPQTQLV